MKTFKLILNLAAICFGLTLHSESHAEVTSFVFKDVITSQGSGSIDLFKPKNNKVSVDSAKLEAFRLDNNGKLVFSVDINEASDGSENADSQGITFKSAELILEFADQVIVTNQFTTKTKTLVKSVDNPTPTEYFTMLGEAGSSLVTPNADSELFGSSFDSTLSFKVDVDLSDVVNARVEITLLDVLPNVGDPEDYYDYSNGFEEIALLSAEDAAYLDQLAPGRDFAPLVISDQPQADNWTFYPASGAFYIVAYEDLFPNKGDYDFNDLVVAYQLKVATNPQGETTVVRGSGFLISRGGVYDHTFYLGLDLPSGITGTYDINFFNMGSHTPANGYPKTQAFNGSINIPLAENVMDTFYDGESTYVNTFPDQNIVQGPKFEFQVNLDSPFNNNFAQQAPFDPFILVHDTNYEIHLVGHDPALANSNNIPNNKVSFKDSNGYPFAMLVSEEWMPPLAGEDLGIAYPEFVDHVKSSGGQKKGWYLNPNNNKIKSIPFLDWTW
jgi:LruC domain-containing protein